MWKWMQRNIVFGKCVTTCLEYSSPLSICYQDFSSSWNGLIYQENRWKKLGPNFFDLKLTLPSHLSFASLFGHILALNVFLLQTSMLDKVFFLLENIHFPPFRYSTIQMKIVPVERIFHKTMHDWNSVEEEMRKSFGIADSIKLIFLWWWIFHAFPQKKLYFYAGWEGYKNLLLYNDSYSPLGSKICSTKGAF